MKPISSYVPNHLVPLLQPNPTGIHKLLAAWDGLSTGEQIILMVELSNSTISDTLEEKVISKALDNNNAYVRYLAAQLAKYDKGEIRERVNSDSDPLVRYSVLENEYSLTYGSEPESCDEFYNLPQPARLAIVRNSRGGGENFSKLISYGMEHQVKEGVATEEQLFEIICDYVCKPGFSEYYTEDQISYNGFGDYLDGKAIEEMWKLVVRLPEQLSRPLIENLPISADPSPEDDLLDEVKQNLSDRQLAILFYRKDVRLSNFRKSIFFSLKEELKSAKDAATCYHFDFNYSEFADILKLPPKKSAYKQPLRCRQSV
jgi:hypothetical protein